MFDISKTSQISTIQSFPLYTYYVEGQVIFENADTSCPLESISRINPYVFTNDVEVLHLTNRYNGTNTVTHMCSWKFKALVGYGFKVVVEELDVDEDTRLTVENRTDILLK